MIEESISHVVTIILVHIQSKYKMENLVRIYPIYMFVQCGFTILNDFDLEDYIKNSCIKIQPAQSNSIMDTHVCLEPLIFMLTRDYSFAPHALWFVQISIVWYSIF